MGLRARMRREVHVDVVTESGANSDDYGNPVDSAAETRVYFAWVAQTSTGEDNITRQTARASWTILLPPEADGFVVNYATVRFDNETARVVSVPNPVYSGRGLHHVEIIAETFEG